jgi:hypothetical protein
MNHKDVLKRAWDTTLKYPALLVFGIIVALTAGGGGGQGFRYTASSEDFAGPWGFERTHVPPELVVLLVTVGVSLCCLTVVIVIASVVARYVADTALVRLVNDREETGETRGLRRGFQEGWSRIALRFFGIDLVTGIPAAVVFTVLFLLSGGPLLLWIVDSTAARVIGTVAAIGLFFLVLLLVILLSAALSVLVDFARRACAVEELGVLEAIARGYRVLTANLKDAALMWLIMVGLGIGWAIVMTFVVALLLLLGVLVGGLPALVVGAVLSLIGEGAAPWVIGSLVAAPAFIGIVAMPSIVLGGLAQVFSSSVWTLTYRELVALE